GRRWRPAAQAWRRRFVSRRVEGREFGPVLLGACSDRHQPQRRPGCELVARPVISAKFSRNSLCHPPPFRPQSAHPSYTPEDHEHGTESSHLPRIDCRRCRHDRAVVHVVSEASDEVSFFRGRLYLSWGQTSRLAEHKASQECLPYKTETLPTTKGRHSP